MTTPRLHGRWLTVCWTGAVVATAVNGVLVGWGAVAIQFFGQTASGEDYRVSAGGYGAAAVVLALAVPALLTRRGPRWLVWPAGVAAAVLALLAVRAALVAPALVDDRTQINGVWDGIGGVIWAPWTWALVGLGAYSLVRPSTTEDSG